MKNIFSVFNPDSVKKYFANTSWLMAEKIVRAIITLFVGIYVVRYLGPSNFGLLSYCLSFVALFATFSTLGLNAIVTKNLVRDIKQSDTLLGTAFCLQIAGAVLALLILGVAVHFTANDDFTNLLIFLIGGGLIFQSFNVIDFYFQSKVLSKFVVFAHFFQLIVISILKIYLVVTGASLVWFAIAALCESIVLALGLIVMYFKHKLSLITWRVDFSMAKGLLKNSFPLIISGIGVAIYLRIDQVMIKEMLNSESVGLYAVAVKICEAWHFIPLVITGSLFPAIINARKNDLSIYYDRLQRLYDLMALLAILIAIPLAIFAGKIVYYLFGPTFNGAGPVLQIIIWSNLFTFLGLANGKFLFAENLEKYYMYRILLGGAINIILNLLLIPLWGIQGAAIATIISYSCEGYWGMAFFATTRKNFLMTTRSFNIFKSIKRLLNAS